MNTITEPKDVREYGRPIGKVDDKKIQSYINEVENTIIRKRIGDELYLTLTSGELTDDTLRTLVEGGEYVYNGAKRILTGMKAAIAYYVNAQNFLVGDFESTRFGTVVKDDVYSQGVTQKERAELAGSCTTIADAYLNECIDYCKKMNIKQCGGGQSLHITSGCVIRKIKM